MSVLLPAPFSPHSTWISPFSSVKDTPSRARTPGKSLVMWRSSRRAIGGLGLRALLLGQVAADVLELVVAVLDHGLHDVGLVHRDRVEQDAGHVLLAVVHAHRLVRERLLPREQDRRLRRLAGLVDQGLVDGHGLR